MVRRSAITTRTRDVACHWAYHWISGGLCLLLALQGCSNLTPSQREYVAELVKHRTQKDQLMASEEGPLTKEQRGPFKGLAYFNPNFELVLQLDLQSYASIDTVLMTTSGNTSDPYQRLGKLEFNYRSKDYGLTLYRALDSDYLFLPFIDQTSGDESYGGGRYVDVKKLPSGQYEVDFNLSYNPYCAYNSTWVCPIPPLENFLDFKLSAGERVYPYHGSKVH